MTGRAGFDGRLGQRGLTGEQVYSVVTFPSVGYNTGLDAKTGQVDSAMGGIE